MFGDGKQCSDVLRDMKNCETSKWKMLEKTPLPSSCFFFTCLLDGMREAFSEAFFIQQSDATQSEEKYHGDSKKEIRAKGFKQVDYK